MNCHECQHSKRVIGSSHHLKCFHPVITNGDCLKAVFDIIEPYLQNDQTLYAIIVVIARILLGITIDEHGYKHGWAYWPVNFDQIWISGCTGFLAKEIKNDTND